MGFLPRLGEKEVVIVADGLNGHTCISADG